MLVLCNVARLSALSIFRPQLPSFAAGGSLYSTSQSKEDPLLAELLDDIRQEVPGKPAGEGDTFAQESTIESGQKMPTKRHRRRMNLGPKEASSRLCDVKGSMKKVRVLTDLVKGLNYREAIAQLTLAPQRAADDVMRCLKAARAHAEHNLGLNPDRLLIAYVTVGRGRTYRSVEFRARARANVRRRRRTNIEVVLREVPYSEGEKRLGKYGRVNLEWKNRGKVQPSATFYDIDSTNFIDVEPTPSRVQESN